MVTLATQVLHDLSGLLKRLKPTESRSKTNNLNPLLMEAFIWQEARRYCEQQEKASRKELDSASTLGEAPTPGDHILLDGGPVIYLARVTKPRVSFDLDMFIHNVSKKYKLREAEVRTMVDPARRAGKSAVSRVLIER
jgi:hypothetical protein